ncbi:MAG: hypothetical protein JWO94_2468 [Verrucomicrobiaceae bacterium]|nr:hypothetical protein [Verrucomicrobiaceae bacterium]
MNPPPPPFGDPAQVERENRTAIKRGVFAGCGGCALIVLAVALFITCLFGFVMHSFRDSDVCTQAMARAASSGEVRAFLGSPVQQGWMINGSINLQNSDGTADVTFPISGPKGSGTLHAEASKKNGTWIFSQLLFIPDSTRRPIDLLTPISVTQSVRPLKLRDQLFVQPVKAAVAEHDDHIAWPSPRFEALNDRQR